MGMSKKAAKDAFLRVCVAYPSIDEFLDRSADGKATIDAWCEMISGCDQGDVDQVVAAIVRGEIEPIERYEKPDALPRRIRQAANERRSARDRKEEQKRKYHVTERSLAEIVAKGGNAKIESVAHMVIEMGARLRSEFPCRITPEYEAAKAENDRKVDELLDWANDRGPLPAWMEQQAAA